MTCNWKHIYKKLRKHSLLNVGGIICILRNIFKKSVNALQPKPTRNTPTVEQVEFVTCYSEGEHMPWRTVGQLCKRVLESIMALSALERYQLGDFRGGSKEAEVCSRLDAIRKWWQFYDLVKKAVTRWERCLVFCGFTRILFLSVA